MKLFEILIPVCDNAGFAFEIDHNHIWDRKVLSIAGGLTRLNVVDGQWINPSTGNVIHEDMIPVKIACSQDQIDEIADFTAKHYSQLAVMYYMISDNAIIKNYE